MKKILLAIFFWIAFTSVAFADRYYHDRDHHEGFGFHLFVNPAPPVYYYGVPQYSPPVYSIPVEQWFFCERPYGYYPYVQYCSLPWRTIVR